MDGFPRDGDRVNPGASSKLIMIIKPLSVAFKNIAIKEKAHRGDGHDPGNNFIKPNIRNEVLYDNVGRRAPTGFTVTSTALQNYRGIGQEKKWYCGFYTYANNRYCCHISGQDFIQKSKFERDKVRPDGNYNLKVTVSKFGSSTSRSTLGQALHHDVNAPE